MGQMLFYDFIDIFFINVVVPHPFRVDHQHRPLRTAIKTTGGINPHTFLARKPQRLHPLLRIVTNLGRTEALATFTTTVTLISTKEYMVFKIHGRKDTRETSEAQREIRAPVIFFFDLLAQPFTLHNMDKATFIKEADRCVKCGLCLPHCPTYQQLQDEGDSPRGRIALMQGLAQKKLPLSEKLIDHLDRCLVCRACEAMCPSGVKYGELIETTRASIINETDAPDSDRATGMMQHFVTQPTHRRHLSRLLRVYQSSGLGWLVRHSGLLRPLGLQRLEGVLPKLSSALPTQHYHPPIGEQKGEIGLFAGCMGDSLDTATIHAAIRLLTHLGYGVHLPPKQNCCGALHLHRGDLKQADVLASENRNAFSELNIDALIYCASGCGSTLQKLRQIGRNDAPVMEIGQFLAQAEWPETLALRPLGKQIAIHLPCSLSHVLKQGHAPEALLSRIPGVKTVPLPDNQNCCGAAGDYMIRHPEIADELRDNKLRQLDTMRPDILVSSNIGCALHIAAGIREVGLKIEVIHPVTLLARQLP